MKAKEPNQLAVIVGTNIAKLRKFRQLSQAELAEKIGVEVCSLLRMEKGRVEPKFANLQKIAEALECAPHDLFKPENTACSADDLSTAAKTCLDRLGERDKAFAVNMLSAFVGYVSAQDK